MNITTDPILDVCQADTEPFLHFELEAIDRYRALLAGTPDWFDDMTFGSGIGETSLADHVAEIKVVGGMLADWRAWIDGLRADLSDIGDPTTAGLRFLEFEVAGWTAAVDAFHRGAVMFLVGAAGPYLRTDAACARFVDGRFWVPAF